MSSKCLIVNSINLMLVRMEQAMAELKIGDRMKIPVHSVFHQEAEHYGIIVYISEDKETVTVKCEHKHGGKTVAFNIALIPREY
ncbi:MAG: hypothetical protein P8X87_06995 [Candidatus Bathyarchaeota archaeon]